MSWRDGAWRSDRPIDFFISYSPADERWATWIAWELESAGYRTMLQAWDFVAGTRFLDFMDRGVRDSLLVIAVLSPNYLRSTYGALEWQAALNANPVNPATKLVTVRVEECRIEGLLATITYVDLVGVYDSGLARARLVSRIEEANGGRAKPSVQPHYPQQNAGSDLGLSGLDRRGAVRRPRSRRTPVEAPSYPRSAQVSTVPRQDLGILHIGGTRFGRGLLEPGAPVKAEEVQAQIWGELTRFTDNGGPLPELVVVTGDLTESGTPREFEEALTFLTGIRVLLGLETHRVVLVPGPRDVTLAACRAYFANCEADDVEPRPPYWPKWRHFARMFDEFYQGIEGLSFDRPQCGRRGPELDRRLQPSPGPPVRSGGSRAGRVVRVAPSAIRGRRLAPHRRDGTQPAVRRVDPRARVDRVTGRADHHPGSPAATEPHAVRRRQSTVHIGRE
jgi:hypothetical protein